MSYTILVPQSDGSSLWKLNPSQEPYTAIALEESIEISEEKQTQLDFENLAKIELMRANIFNIRKLLQKDFSEAKKIAEIWGYYLRASALLEHSENHFAANELLRTAKTMLYHLSLKDKNIEDQIATLLDRVSNRSTKRSLKYFQEKLKNLSKKGHKKVLRKKLRQSFKRSSKKI